MKPILFEESARERLNVFQDSYELDRIPLCEPNSPYGETLYIENRGKILGVASAVKNGIHPKFDHLYLSVSGWDQEITTILLEGLKRHRGKEANPLQILIKEADVEKQKLFTDSQDFSLILTCNCPKIDTNRSIDKLLSTELPTSLRFTRYSQLNKNERDKLRKFRLNGYVKTHFWSPPTDLNDDVWSHTDRKPEEEDISWAVFNSDNLILCSDGIYFNDSIWLGWGWHGDELDDDPYLLSIWSHVLYLQLLDCQRLEKSMYGEFDSTDKYGQVKSKLLLHLTKDIKYIYQEKSNETVTR